MNRGWVKDWRKAEDNPLYWDIGPWHLFSHLIRSAKYQDTGELSRGQCLINCHNLAKCYGVNRSTIHRWLDKLRKTGLISSRVVVVPNRATRNLVVTIDNYETYQSNEPMDATSPQQACNKPATSPQQLLKEEGKNEEGNNKDTSKFKYTEEFCKWWKTYPLRKGKKDAFEAWRRARARVASVMSVELSEAAEYLVNMAIAFANSEVAAEDGGRYIPHPATWLNQGRYDDEEEETQTTASRFE